MRKQNPFNNLTNNPEFIGRERDLSLLNECIKRGQSVVLYAPSGAGKTALFNECCLRYKYSKKYVVMRCDLTMTNNMNDFTTCLINSMEPFTTGTDLKNKFIKLLNSIKAEIVFDPIGGAPTFNLCIRPDEHGTTLEQIKLFINSSAKQYLLYIDEFQQIVRYPDNNVEALLQSFFGSLHNLVCILSGSQNRIVKELLTTKMQSFYSHLSIIELSPIDCLDFTKFAVEKFKRINVTIDEKTVENTYNLLEGSVLYMQILFSNLYSSVESGSTILFNTIISEIKHFFSGKEFLYKYILKNCTKRQSEFLIMLAHNIQPTERKYAHAKAKFLKNETISCKDQRFYIKDKFFRVWLRENYPLLNNEELENDYTENRESAQISISKKDRENLLISLAYLTEMNWAWANEKALVVQLKEILANNDVFCPDSPRFRVIYKYLDSREEASLDSNMVEEIKLYIKSIKA